jgi:hypothetical protein
MDREPKVRQIRLQLTQKWLRKSREKARKRLPTRSALRLPLQMPMQPGAGRLPLALHRGGQHAERCGIVVLLHAAEKFHLHHLSGAWMRGSQLCPCLVYIDHQISRGRSQRLRLHPGVCTYISWARGLARSPVLQRHPAPRAARAGCACAIADARLSRLTRGNERDA